MAGGGFDLTGVEEMRQLGRDLKTAGAKDLRKELLAAGRELKKPYGEALRRHALSDLPASGGLNVWVAGRLKVSSQVRLAGPSVGVRFKTRHRGVKGLSDLPRINAGSTRHPLFGERDHWYLTSVPAGFADRALDEMGDTMRQEFLQAVDRVTAALRARG